MVKLSLKKNLEGSSDLLNTKVICIYLKTPNKTKIVVTYKISVLNLSIVDVETVKFIYATIVTAAIKVID